jgi:hypothetical protein
MYKFLILLATSAVHSFLFYKLKNPVHVLCIKIDHIYDLCVHNLLLALRQKKLVNVKLPIPSCMKRCFKAIRIISIWEHFGVPR